MFDLINKQKQEEELTKEIEKAIESNDASQFKNVNYSNATVLKYRNIDVAVSRSLMPSDSDTYILCAGLKDKRDDIISMFLRADFAKQKAYEDSLCYSFTSLGV